MSKSPISKESLLKKTIIQDGCWLYQGATCGKYGHCQVDYYGKTVYLHRLSAHLHWGFDLDSPLLILHRCKNSNCWNPEHLYEGTYEDNALDSVETGTNYQKSKTHCPKGHEYTPENTYIPPNGKERRCKICRRNNR